MGTRGKVKALTALGAQRSKNKARILEGKAPVIGGKKVSAKKFKKATGTSVATVKKKAVKAAGGSVKKAKRKAAKQAAASTKSAKRAAKLVKGKPGKKVKPGAFAKKKG